MADLPPAIVSPQWLHKKLSAEPGAVQVLDVSWYKDREAKEEYMKVHIPGARYFDFLHGTEPTEHIPRNVPEAGVFEKYVRSLGINDDTHTVLYDNSGNCGYYIGSRVWWLFRLNGVKKVSILDGGLDRWLACGYEVSSVEPTFKKGNFTVKYNGSLKKSYEEMVANTRSREFQVVDCRSKEAFAGSPDDEHSGHIPAAINLPAGLMTDKESKSFRESQQIKKVFSEAGVDMEKPMLMMCATCTTACAVALGAYQCGFPDVPVYLGSWTEWRQRADPSLIEQTV